MLEIAAIAMGEQNLGALQANRTHDHRGGQILSLAYLLHLCPLATLHFVLWINKESQNQWHSNSSCLLSLLIKISSRSGLESDQEGKEMEDG